jgi:phosphoribosylamine--glycine ligase
MILDSLFAQKNQKGLIEDYIWGAPFTFYAITDGYKALPLGSSLMYKYSLEGDGGQLTNGMGACSPNYKLSLENEYFLMDNVIYPILEYIESEGNPYVGILGVDGILTDEGSLQVIGLQHFTQECDTNAVLEIVDTDLIELFNSCIVGSFSDEYEYINQLEISTTSLVLQCKNKDSKFNTINGLEQIGEEVLVAYYPNVVKNRYLEYEASQGNVMILTAKGSTVASSTKKVYSEAEGIDFKGVYYRKDICKSLKSSFNY